MYLFLSFLLYIIIISRVILKNMCKIRGTRGTMKSAAEIESIMIDRRALRRVLLDQVKASIISHILYLILSVFGSHQE